MADENDDKRPARKATKTNRSAALLGMGTLLTLPGVGALLIGVGLAAGWAPVDYESNPGQPWLVAGGLAVLLGSILLAHGVLRLADHADRAAGVTVRDPLG